MNTPHIREELDRLHLRVETILQAVHALADDISRLQLELDDVPWKETA